MKKCLLFMALIITCFFIKAQTPQSFNYQAVVRNADGTTITNQPIAAKISIIGNNINGSVLYTETHSVSTNNIGLINLTIGTGNVSLGSFSNINWANDLYFIKIEIDPNGGNNYQISGVSQLLSVPYAMFAQKAGNVNLSDTSSTNELQTISILGNDLSISNGNTVTLPIITYIAGADIDISGNSISNTAPNANHTGDATGSGALTVTGIQGKAIANTNPTDGYVLKWNTLNNRWEPSTDLNTTYTAGTGINISGTTINSTVTGNATHSGDASGATAITVTGIQGNPVLAGTPTNGQILKWNTTNARWEASTDLNTTYTSGTGINISGTTINNTLTSNATHTGDATGSGVLTVVALRGKIISTASPTDNQFLKWNNTLSQWEPSTINQSQWITSGNNIFNGNTGNVGIGTSTPNSKLEVKGTGDTLFQVKDANGNPVFIVFPEGVRVIVKEGAVKGNLGGFAVSGRSATKTTTYEDVLLVTPDSTRVFVNQNAKGNLGGFAVSGRSATKGLSTFTHLVPDNYFIGHQAGKSITTGKYNSFIGYESGIKNNTGSKNYFIGYRSGYNNLDGTSNINIGDSTGFSNESGRYNIFIGNQSGYKNLNSNFNTFLGYQAGYNNTGNDNTFIGYKAGYGHLSKGGNVYIGSKAGELSQSGEQNIVIGEAAGQKITTGSKNVFMGYSAGNSNTSGNSNIFIGNVAGYSNLTGNSNVLIGDSAGYINKASNNVFIGNRNGFKNTSGTNNVFLGNNSGYYNTFGKSNIYIGNNVGFKNTGGNRNVFMGDSSGYLNTSSDNVFIGNATGRYNTIGSNHVFIGNKAGYKNTTSFSNIFIGENAGYTNSTGSYNVFMGVNSGYSNSSGEQNVFLGYEAGYSNDEGINNIFIGNNAGRSNIGDGTIINGGYNLFIGCNAGRYNTTGFSNIYLGENSEINNKTGKYNVAIGRNAGAQDTSGSYNVTLGAQASEFRKKGDNNVSLGYNAAGSSGNILQTDVISVGNAAGFNRGGIRNVYLGNQTAYTSSIKTDTGCIFIGYKAGYGLTTNQKNKLYIGTDVNTVIYGEIDSAQIGINTSSPTQTLDVNGNARFRSIPSNSTLTRSLYITTNGTLAYSTSDYRLKKNISPLSANILEKVLSLQGVNFIWKSDTTNKVCIGFIAQDMEKVFPELVFTNPVDGYKGINYSEYTAVLNEAVKEQQKTIESQKQEIEKLKQKNKEFEEKFKQMEFILKEIESIKTQIKKQTIK